MWWLSQIWYILACGRPRYIRTKGMNRRRSEFIDGFNKLLRAWLQIGYKIFENTEQINIFRKSNDRKARKNAICHIRFSRPNP